MTVTAREALAGNRRILIAALVGTAVEFYDFYIYATAAALVLGPLFFPSGDASVELLSSYASFGLAFVARPLGAIAFGHFGDRVGRKSTLVASLMLMGGSTVLIGCLPTYATLGWWAPLLLCLLRFGQGFGLGGEWGGAALLAVENAPPGWRARFGMAPQLGAPVGFLAANGLFLVLGATLSDAQFAAWGWRVPFILSAVLVGIGLWVRLKIAETPAFAEVLAEGPPAGVPVAEALRSHGGQVLRGTLGVVACFAIFYLSTTFALGYGTKTLGIAREHFLVMQLGAILFMALGIVLAGWWADESNERRVLMWGCAGTLFAGLAMVPLFGAGTVGIMAFLCLALLVMGFVYGPLGAWLPHEFPARVRYTGASIAFNAGGILGGALTPFAATALAGYGLWAVGAYLAAAGALSWLGLALSGR